MLATSILGRVSLILAQRVPSNKHFYGLRDVAIMSIRRGEKIGWTAGWLGGFIWVAGLSLVFLYQQKLLQGIMCLLLFCVAFVSLIALAPWRYSRSGAYLVDSPLNAAAFFIVPVGSIGKRRWTDFEAK